jgi:hypothetical protein
VDVGVERALGGQARRRPVLPVVEVPAKLLEDRVGRVERERRPAGPRLLVGLPEEADVVDLEAGRAPLIRGLELEARAADLGEGISWLVPFSDVRVGSKVSLSSGAGRGATGSRWVRAIAAVSPATRLRSNELETS